MCTRGENAQIKKEKIQGERITECSENGNVQRKGRKDKGQGIN